MSTFSSSNTDEPPQEDNHQPSFISSLPENLVLTCLARVPRSYYLNLSRVSNTLRSLVRSPEFHRLRSFLLKKPLYLYFCDDTTYHWLTLRQIEKTTTRTIEYRLVPVQFPSHPFMNSSLTVLVGSEIYFVGRPFEPSSDVWILDTRSREFTQGPSMKVARRTDETAVGVIDGKIYVITVVVGCEEEIQVEVLDPETRIWKFAGEEKMPPRPWRKQHIASVARKVFMVERGSTRAYNPREGGGKPMMVHMVSETLSECNARDNGRRKERRERLSEDVDGVCVVENVLYALFRWIGLMWFDTKLNVWRSLVTSDRVELLICDGLRVLAMAEYEGKLAVFHSHYPGRFDKTKSVTMFLFSLDRVGERICGTIEWSGIVATIPYCSTLLHCLVASD